VTEGVVGPRRYALGQMAERSARSSPSETDDGLAFKDPANRRGLHFAVLPMTKLEVISHQRKPSDAHVKRVVDSVERVGFLAPVVVVESGGAGYLIIDGQHRFLAAKELGLRRIPAVIAPPDVARRMLTLNVEKEPNIRERSAVALSLYRDLVESEPKMSEDDTEVSDAVQHAHYVTLGLAYADYGRLAGSSYEPILRKCDGFMDQPSACRSVRDAPRRWWKRTDSSAPSPIGSKRRERGTSSWARRSSRTPTRSSGRGSNIPSTTPSTR
jgi:hypothetical protein